MDLNIKNPIKTSQINSDIPLSVKNLSSTFKKQQVLSEVSFFLEKQKILILMGKNGSGKTVLLKTILYILPPTSGQSFLWGNNVYKMNYKTFSSFSKKIGYVFQNSALFDSMTILDNILFSLKRFSNESKDVLIEKAIQSLEYSGLPNAEHKFPHELSGGMRKRVGIARAISHSPELFIMDDPAAGLDPILTDSIANLILKIKQEKKSTFIISTHELQFAYKLADEIALIHQGKIVCIVPKNEFKYSANTFVRQFREGILDGPINLLN